MTLFITVNYLDHWHYYQNVYVTNPVITIVVVWNVNIASVLVILYQI